MFQLLWDAKLSDPNIPSEQIKTRFISAVNFIRELDQHTTIVLEDELKDLLPTFPPPDLIQPAEETEDGKNAHETAEKEQTGNTPEKYQTI